MDKTVAIENLRLQALRAALWAGSPVEVRPATSKVKRWGIWWDEGPHFSVLVGDTSMTLSYDEARGYLWGIVAGAKTVKPARQA